MTAWHVICSGNIGKTMQDLRGKWDIGSFDWCKLTGKINGVPTRVLSHWSFKRQVLGLRLKSYEFSYCCGEPEDIKIAESRMERPTPTNDLNNG